MGGLQEFDLSVFRAVNSGLHREGLDWFFAVVSTTGLGWFPTLVPFLFLLRKETRHYTLPLVLTVIVSGIILADGVKSLIQRDRPSNLPGAYVQEQVFHSSFPSGHTTTSFGFAMMLTLLAWNSRYRWIIAGASFAWALLVGLSRIYRGVHWPTDVIGGACFGVAGACLVSLCLPKLGRHREDN